MNFGDGKIINLLDDNGTVINDSMIANAECIDNESNDSDIFNTESLDEEEVEEEFVNDDSDEEDIDEETLEALGGDTNDGRVAGSCAACIIHTGSFLKQSIDAHAKHYGMN